MRISDLCIDTLHGGDPSHPPSTNDTKTNAASNRMPECTIRGAPSDPDRRDDSRLTVQRAVRESDVEQSKKLKVALGLMSEKERIRNCLLHSLLKLRQRVLIDHRLFPQQMAEQQLSLRATR